MSISTIIKIILLVLITPYIGYSQSEPKLYEQIAFDFYITTILKSYPVTSKLQVEKKITPNASYNYFLGECLKNKIKNGEPEVIDIDVEKYLFKFNKKKYELDLTGIDTNKFKKKNKIRYFNNSITVYRHRVYKNRIFIMIEQQNIKNGYDFTIEIDKNGLIVDWCKSGEFELIPIH